MENKTYNITSTLSSLINNETNIVKFINKNVPTLSTVTDKLSKKQDLINLNNKLSAAYIDGLPSGYIKLLVDPGLYTAFLVTATDEKKTMKFDVLADGDTFNATSESIGDYDVVVDWGDGTTTTKSSADFVWAYKNKVMKYYNHQFAAKRIDVTYTHTYVTNGTYKIKITGTTYYQFRCNTEATNIISRCMEYDLPLYSGLTRLQGAFGASMYLTKVDCPTNYVWPTNVLDISQMFANCYNLLSVGNMIIPEGVLGTVGMFSYAKKLKKRNLDC